MARTAGSAAGRPTMWKVVVTICLLVAAILFGAVARQTWTHSSEEENIVRLEGNGAAMMHKMTTLLQELVAAQSAAVLGAPIDQDSVRSALFELGPPDSAFGDELQTRQRLSDLNRQVDVALGSGVTGREAYSVWSALVDLAVDLIRVIGDSSHLIHDPDLDSYYLMDAAIIRLPDAMVYAGRAADLAALTSSAELAGEDLMRAAVARFNVSADAEQVSAGLTASVDATARSELGANIAQRLDLFRAAADSFAPPTMLQELATEVDAATLAENASRVFQTAGSLSHLLLSELQALLEVRAEGIAEQRRLTAISTAAAAVLVIAIMWLLLAGSRRRGPDRSLDEPTTGARGFASVGFENGANRDGPAGRGGATGRGGSGTDLAGAGARRSGHAR